MNDMNRAMGPRKIDAECDNHVVPHNRLLPMPRDDLKGDPLPLSERVAAKILRRQALVNGDRPFVWFESEWVTYRQANQRANRIGNALRDLGIKAAARVSILMRNRIEYLDLWFGLSRIAAVQMPLNTEFKVPQFLQVLQRTPVEAIVVEECFVPELVLALKQLPVVPLVVVLRDKSSATVKDLSDIEPQEGAAVPLVDYGDLIARASSDDVEGEQNVSGANVGVIMNTSGTTGPAKGVLMSHAQQYVLGRNMSAHMQIESEDVFYNYFPLFHNTAQAMITIPVLLSGARMVLRERFSASGFWPDVVQHRCTAFYFIAEILHILLKSTMAMDAHGSHLRTGWGIGGAAADYIEFESRFGVRLGTGYGSTEANVPVFMPSDQYHRPGSSGRAIPGFDILVADDDGHAVALGTVGEILVKSYEPCSMMLGYDGDPQATAAAWRGPWFRSGDAGFIDADGFLFFTGRIKDVIRVRGENVSAFEIELALSDLDGVAEVAAIAVPSELGGDDVKVVVVPSSGTSTTHQSIVDYLKPRLPRYCLPRYVEFVSALPKTPTNKIRKSELRESCFTAKTWDRTTGKFVPIHADRSDSTTAK